MCIPSALLAPPDRVHADSWSSSSCEWFPCATRSAHPRPSPGSADAVPHIPEQDAQILTTKKWHATMASQTRRRSERFLLTLLICCIYGIMKQKPHP